RALREWRAARHRAPASARARLPPTGSRRECRRPCSARRAPRSAVAPARDLRAHPACGSTAPSDERASPAARRSAPGSAAPPRRASSRSPARAPENAAARVGRSRARRARGGGARAPGPWLAGASASAAALELVQHELADGLERFEHAHAGTRVRLEIRHARRVQERTQLLDGNDVRQVALVVLDDVRNLVERIALLGEVGAEVVEAFLIGFEALDLRVGHEDHAVDTLEDELAARVVEHLTRHRVQVEPGLEAADLTERERQEVEEERPLGLGGKAYHLAFGFGIRALVDVLQVRGFSAETRSVIDDLAVDLPGHVVDEAHRPASVVEEIVDVLVGDLGER